jgi:hypothetical protein
MTIADFSFGIMSLRSGRFLQLKQAPRIAGSKMTGKPREMPLQGGGLPGMDAAPRAPELSMIQPVEPGIGLSALRRETAVQPPTTLSGG